MDRELLHFLQCDICKEDFNLKEKCAKILPCGHTLCLSCASESIARKEKPCCPTCQQEITIKNAIEIADNKIILEMVKKVYPEHTVGKCHTHAAESITFVCEQCLEGICDVCIESKINGPHGTHPIKRLQDFNKRINEEKRQIFEHKARIDAKLSMKNQVSLKGVQNEYECLIEKVNGRAEVAHSKIDEWKDEISNQASKYFDKCKAKVKRRTELIEQRLPQESSLHGCDPSIVHGINQSKFVMEIITRNLETIDKVTFNVNFSGMDYINMSMLQLPTDANLPDPVTRIEMDEDITVACCGVGCNILFLCGRQSIHKYSFSSIGYQKLGSYDINNVDGITITTDGSRFVVSNAQGLHYFDADFTPLGILTNNFGRLASNYQQRVYFLGKDVTSVKIFDTEKKNASSTQVNGRILSMICHPLIDYIALTYDNGKAVVFQVTNAQGAIKAQHLLTTGKIILCCSSEFLFLADDNDNTVLQYTWQCNLVRFYPMSDFNRHLGHLKNLLCANVKGKGHILHAMTRANGKTFVDPFFID